MNLTPTDSPLYRSKNGQWRALNNGSPVQPSAAFSYISRAFRQTTSHFMGALRLLAESYTPEELNRKAWVLYTQFRPEVNEWGKRSEVSCSKILALRKQQADSLQCRPAAKAKESMLAVGAGLEESLEGSEGSNPHDKSPSKKARLLDGIEQESKQEINWDPNAM